MNSAIRNSKSETPVKRLTAVRVGDLLQYVYYYEALGMMQGATSTRNVIEVIDGGASFLVTGGLRVEAKQVMTHIPMHGSDEQTAEADTLED